MKPRMSPANNGWKCWGLGTLAFGTTIRDAYVEWLICTTAVFAARAAAFRSRETGD